MRMTASWFRSSPIDRIQVCGATLAPDGELPSDRFVFCASLDCKPSVTAWLAMADRGRLAAEP